MKSELYSNTNIHTDPYLCSYVVIQPLVNLRNNHSLLHENASGMRAVAGPDRYLSHVSLYLHLHVFLICSYMFGYD